MKRTGSRWRPWTSWPPKLNKRPAWGALNAADAISNAPPVRSPERCRRGAGLKQAESDGRHTGELWTHLLGSSYIPDAAAARINRKGGRTIKVDKAHCLFEQSGTFKHEFLALGISAEDYDIRNDFGETDHVVDLFAEIDLAYDGKQSIFDNIGPGDLVMAFFPCTRFECQSQMMLSGVHYSLRNYTDEQKLEYAMKTHNELHRLYTLICKLFAIANRGGGGWRMIVENPATPPHYLTGYFPIKPKIIDNDRTENGDYFKKPTQFWFVNCDPEQNMFFEPLEFVETGNIERAKATDGISRVVRRSMIHPQYARRFIKAYITDNEE